METMVAPRHAEGGNFILERNLPRPERPARRPEDVRPRLAALLAHTIERQIIPRLVLTRPVEPLAARRGAPVQRVVATDIEELISPLLACDADAAIACVRRVLGRGVAVEELCLHLLAPAARRLGALWDEDRCDFTQVTIGVWQLRQILRVLSPRFDGPMAHPESRRRVLLASVPGEQHTFGIAMVAEFFRLAGWVVRSGPIGTPRELCTIVGAEWFAVVGLSASSDSKLDALAGAIRQIRRASRNPGVGVMVGGRLFINRPELARRMGADATATDARLAPLQADGLISLLAART